MKPIAGSSSSLLPLVAGAAVLGLLVPAVLAHGEEEEHGHADSGMSMGGMQMSEADKPLPEDQYAPTYFALPDHRAAVLGHIAVMVLAWVFALPAAVMLSLARSRYTLAVQLVFLAANAVGVLLGVVYNANTPDLYPNNAHHKLGWIVTFVVSAQVVVGLLARVAGVLQRKSPSSRNGSGSRAEERQGFIPVPVSTQAMAEHESRFPTNPYGRFSNDSGQGTEPRTESLRSHSLSSGADSPTTATSPIREAHSKEYHPGGDHDDDDDFDDEDFDGDDNDVGGGGHLPMFPKSTRAHSLVAKAAGKISDRFWKVLMFAYNFVDRTILILGFIALCTGIIAYGRLFEGIQIFSGLAHWIKGGVFFWLGIFTLGRWAGSFGDLGWAWNVRPKKAGQGWRPSAEFVESGLIFFYGSTNIFLEHLGGWGGAWSSQDLEHISLTVLFIGGGLCGMLIESTRIRNLLNYHITEAANTTTQSHQLYPHRTSDEERNTPEPASEEPDTYAHSMNPIPALVILLTGIMMSSHTQESMVSSMVHSQWGNLLTGASFARGVTYLITWLKPPKSVYPSRPPSELLTSFGLLSGGVIFMASASDTITGMIHYQLDAMFIYTVTMGLVGLLMAWIILCVAIKGWAARREAARA